MNNSVFMTFLYLLFLFTFIHSQSSTKLPIAYVITTKLNLTDNTIKAAAACGFRPHLVAAVKPYGEIYDWEPDNVYFSCVKNIAGLYLRPKTTIPERCLTCSHKKVYDLIINDNTIGDKDWSIIFEDDAGLHPKVTPAEIQESLHHAIAISNSLRLNSSEGFIYFGLGSAACDRNRYLNIPTGKGVRYQKWNNLQVGIGCIGVNSHAYAITKATGGATISVCITDRPGVCKVYESQGKRQFRQYVPRIWNDPDPRLEHDTGVIIQVGRNVANMLNGIGSSLQSSDKFFPLTCFNGWVSDCGEDCSMGDLMSHFSLLTGLCVSRGFHPDHCLAVSGSNYSQPQHRSLFQSFLKEFRIDPIPRPVCPGTHTGTVRRVGGEELPRSVRLSDLSVEQVLKLPRYSEIDLSFLADSSLHKLIPLIHPHATQLLRQIFRWDQPSSSTGFVCVSISSSTAIRRAIKAVLLIHKLSSSPSSVKIFSSSSNGNSLLNQFKSSLLKSLKNDSVTVSLGISSVSMFRDQCQHFSLSEHITPRSLLWWAAFLSSSKPGSSNVVVVPRQYNFSLPFWTSL